MDAMTWLVFGAIMMVLEVFAVGIGFLFIGLGAITVGIATSMSYLATDETMLQFTVFFIGSALWAAILWKPLKKYISMQKETPYKNIVGDIAVVGPDGLKRGHKGQIRWSGTNMAALIDDSCPEEFIPAGIEVKVIAVKGNILYVCKN